MPSRIQPDASPDRPHAAERRRSGPVAAYLAAPLWTLQAPIWLLAPKVQEATAPFAITKPLLFVLFWLSIAGAVAFSAASAAEAPRAIDGLGSRMAWWARLLATIAACLATVATISIVTALLPGFQGLAIGLMTSTLNGALLVLALSVCLSAFLGWRLDHAPRSTNILLTAVAVATIAMIAVIVAGGSDSVVSLFVAVAVAVLNGIVWCGWGRSSTTRRHRP
ncbi:hypothetical protein [Arthrobacter agilis]|uniref:hypothetical protein n=1 Tax=Arthrobacter agilis TaxID=37921 RepID=UPI0027885E23|nr:hypothetical protein [Arthrobacter agilis]MDQ0736418.1 hypothetical protein [Arthrobacter agilis]